MPAATREATRRLSELEVGDVARMVEAAIDPEDQSLLQALGLTDNSRLRVCKRGEPFIIQVRATRIGISGTVADAILVIPDPAQVEPHAGHSAHV